MDTDVLTIMGTRPQFIKCLTLRKEYVNAGINEILIDTGQHYEHNMSKVFFDQLDQPPPDYTLSNGGLSKLKMLSSMIKDLEILVAKIKPKCIVVLGDTVSTLAGSLVAKQLSIKLVHVEAGLRSFDKTMPEEQNRIISDHLSDILFCPTNTAVKNLTDEGISKNVYFSGDVMLDASKRFKKYFVRPKQLPPEVVRGNYDLITIHRADALISKKNLLKRIEYVLDLSNSFFKLLLIHPHTAKKVKEYDIDTSKFISLPPQGYLETQWLLQNCTHFFTDSGGMQKEAFFFKIPTTTMRDTTEWPETLGDGKNKLWNSISEKIKSQEENPFGDGNASEKIANYLKNHLRT
ncbi:UDP-N-acetylglucosamine 2-epimerase (non-hydrolyzing) [Alphaproteobacteria bacterium]|nr:UDP-N-acetylglucosamine 2-epimerase (non-hydrolyzing) [Alphaproteobacteria bacterium]